MSETDEDIMSRDSFNPKGSAFGIYSPNMGSPSAPNVYEEGGEKHHAFNGALMGEMAAQKSKYARKLASMEKTLEQMRSEKNQLNNVLETQRQNFKLAIQ